MKTNLQKIVVDACKDIDLVYPGDSFPTALVKHLIKDLDQELGKVKWMGADPGWDKAIEAVRKEIKSRWI